jgi:hypothetical protein
MTSPNTPAPAFASRRIRLGIELGLYALGAFLRVEHAITFDGPSRGSDYGVHLDGVRWMAEHWRPFFADPTVNAQVNVYPPLWYALAALALAWTGSEKAIASLAVLGWVVRHFFLGKLLHALAPAATLPRLCALALHATLPLSVLIDGKVNPEGLHAGLFVAAAWFLYGMEREAGSAEGISFKTAAAFGAFAGLAILVKATGALLLFAAGAVFALRALVLFSEHGLGVVVRRIVKPGLVAAAVWCAVAGFWCGTNLVQFRHPFPHAWDRGQPDPAMAAVPTLSRRPLEWALPLEWREYWYFPILRTAAEPRPNFWATEITGTWSDVYNRGFCRLRGGDVTHRVWGGLQGALSQNSSAWGVNARCIAVFAKLLHVGVWITLASALAVLYTALVSIRSRFREGSLVLPLLVLLSIVSGIWFALVFPYDNMAVLNPRYLLPAVTPMCACAGFGLARLESAIKLRVRAPALARLGTWVALAAVGFVGAAVLYLRFWR